MTTNAWIDASLTIEPESVAWAGLDRPRLEALTRIEDGDAVTVGRLDCCLHTGTHADAPAHVLAGAPGVDRLPVDAFVGPCHLLRSADREAITKAELQSLGIEALKGRASAARILIATPLQYDGRNFPDRIPVLDPEALELLAWLRPRLLGLNLPSFDALDSREMRNHKRLFGIGAMLLENLWLADLEPGDYQLAAAPIRVRGADAAPVRALLRPLESRELSAPARGRRGAGPRRAT